MAVIKVVPGLDIATHQRHALHGDGALWQEKNCYIDLWIELVHALGGDPHAMLGCALPIDFEGDQWTFFKPSHDLLRAAYGIDVQELTVWRPLLDHAVEHLGAGSLISVEADAFWLPDTAGTDYRTKHSKTTIVLAELDVQARRLGYFHNAGCFTLEGEDFARTFQLDAAGRPLDDPAHLPLFAERVRIDRCVLRSLAALRQLALSDLRRQLAWRPASNPVRRFAERFEQELPRLRERGMDHYHAWAFSTIRQLGAGFELVARQLDWLGALEPDPARVADESSAVWTAFLSTFELDPAARAFERIAAAAKTLIMKAARSAATGRPAACGELFDAMAGDWEAGMAALSRALG